MVPECKPGVYDTLEDVGFDDRSVCSNILIQAVIEQILLIFELVKHLVLVAIGNVLKMMILVENYLAFW